MMLLDIVDDPCLTMVNDDGSSNVAYLGSGIGGFFYGTDRMKNVTRVGK